MSARSALPTAYRRPSEAALDQLVDPGTADTSEVKGVSGTSSTGDNSSNLGDPGNSGDRVVSDNSSGQTGQRPRPEPREHVKLRRSLADEMRDAVWFLSEHGRPRVQLGELIDEAIAEWLERAKVDHNEGEAFPRRGRLR